ncbi:MAG: hypothetical protein KDN19_02360 [Verrucomicrobiae bacterium]|nr:hypothetical protein [Verrucomicrobiae bacterium]
MKPILRTLIAALVAAVPFLCHAATTAYSPTFTVDTRNLTMTELIISGSPTVPWGSESAYTATLYFSGAAPQDVTTKCQWAVAGGPLVQNFWEMAVMNGNILQPGVPSTTPLKITATIERNSGRITSSPFSVTVSESNGMNIGVGFLYPTLSSPLYLRTEGSNYVWRIVAEASGIAANKAGVTFEWKLDGAPIATGKQLDYEITGKSKSRQLSLTATDTEGRVGQAYRWLVCDPPLALDEPSRLIPAVDPFFGEVKDENGNNFQFDPQKTPNGLIILTHGLRGDASDPWLLSMASSIRARLMNLGKPLPNIVVFGWGSLSDPTEYYVGEARDRAILDAKSALVGASVIATDLLVGEVADYILVRPHGQSEGQELADWIRTEINNENIVSSAPIHLIGHSAGGFVMGECGWKVRNICSNLRVTMLDTPFVIFNHVWRFPNPGYLDRYVSSVLGHRLQYPWTWRSELDGTHDIYRLIEGGPNYYLHPILGHRYSHEWYQTTVNTVAAGSDGFGLSPFLTSSGGAVLALKSADSFTSTGEPAVEESPSPPTETTISIAGFTTFGTVMSDLRGFVVSEGAGMNSGISLEGYSFPAGAFALRFTLQFTTPGDGDFLSVSFGDNVPLYTGKDMPLTRDEAITVDVPVERLAGETGDLVFRLASRGAQNAVLVIQDVVAVIIEDPDQDGLSNDEEFTLGTNASKVDTDDDGLSDAAEVNVYATDPLKWDTDGDGASDGVELETDTNPLDPTSKFAIKSFTVESGVPNLQWHARDTRSYRVLRSIEPGFESFDVIASDLPGADPFSSYSDSALPAGLSRMFYKIQLEPQP